MLKDKLSILTSPFYKPLLVCHVSNAYCLLIFPTLLFFNSAGHKLDVAKQLLPLSSLISTFYLNRARLSNVRGGS